MSDIYGFRGGPNYRVSSPEAIMQSAMDAPLGMASTFYDSAVGGAIQSYGLGSAIREMAIPEGEATPTSVLRSAVRMVNPLTAGLESTRLAVQALREDSPALDEETYKASPYYRDNIPWDRGMTVARAKALAEWDDARQVREFYAAKRPITAFLGNIAGQALDPINYVPVGGPMVRAAALSRAGRVGSAALAGAFDAAANTALFGIATRDTRARYGDDVSWQAMVTDIATAALIGTAFGTLGGLWEGRGQAKAREAARKSLDTLRTAQEGRIALNEAIDAVVRGEDVRLSPNATEPMARVARETEEISRAYDTVLSEPTGPVDDPLVRLSPGDIEDLIVRRGAFKNFNEIEYSKSGQGLVKVIWGHGEKSGNDAGSMILKDDVTALPEIIRNFEPVTPDQRRAAADSIMRTWRVDRGGRVVTYGDKQFANGQHLVTIHVDKTGAPLSPPKKAPATPPESRPPVLSRTEDTAEALSIGEPGAGQGAPATDNVRQPVAIDNSMARSAPGPEGRPQAEARIAQPDDAKAIAEQHRVNPETGDFPEMIELDQLRAEGRLTAEDEAEMADAQAAVDDASAYAEALKSVSRCLL